MCTSSRVGASSQDHEVMKPSATRLRQHRPAPSDILRIRPLLLPRLLLPSTCPIARLHPVKHVDHRHVGRVKRAGNTFEASYLAPAAATRLHARFLAHCLILVRTKQRAHTAQSHSGSPPLIRPTASRPIERRPPCSSTLPNPSDCANSPALLLSPSSNGAQ